MATRCCADFVLRLRVSGSDLPRLPRGEKSRRPRCGLPVWHGMRRETWMPRMCWKWSGAHERRTVCVRSCGRVSFAGVAAAETGFADAACCGARRARAAGTDLFNESACATAGCGDGYVEAGG